jgi:hypothetical protein
MFFMQQLLENGTVGSCIEYIPGTVTNNMKCCIPFEDHDKIEKNYAFEHFFCRGGSRGCTWCARPLKLKKI